MSDLTNVLRELVGRVDWHGDDGAREATVAAVDAIEAEGLETADVAPGPVPGLLV